MNQRQAVELIQRFHSSPVLVFGDVMLDSDVECRAVGVATEAPVPLLEMSQETSRLGGAANVANNLARLGVPTHLVGAAGTDHAAVVLKGLLEDAQVCFHPLASERLTTRKIRIRSGAHYYLRIDEEEPLALTAERLQPALDAVRSLLKDVRMIIVSDYDKGMVNAASAASLESLVKQEGGIKILADIKPGNVAHWRHLDLLTPNLDEARALHELLLHEEANGHPSTLATSLGRILNCDIVVKLSGDGLLTATRAGSVTHLEALCQAPQCVTGAGDTVLATLAAALANGATLEDAAYLANVAAAIAVSQPGPHAVSSGELIERLSVLSAG